MRRNMLSLALSSTMLIFLFWGNMSLAQDREGPFGLRWGMSKTDIEALDIRLCCRQLGKWGARFEVNSGDFAKLPKRLGDEEKMYLYFGNNDQLLRIYMAVTKIDGENRYHQIKQLLANRYTIAKQCHWKTSSDCQEYKAFTTYKTGDIDVFVGFEENLTYRDKISITLLHTRLYKADKGTKNPF